MKRCRDKQILLHPQPRGSPERATKLPPKSLFEIHSIYQKTNKAVTEQSPMQKHKAGFTTQGLGKKNTTRRVEIFLDQLVIPLRGAKRLLRQRGSEHLFPAYILTIATRALYRSRNQKTEHLKSGETERGV